MSQTTAKLEEIEWDWKSAPIKHCEFIRSSNKFSHLSHSDIENIVNNVTLGSLSNEDREFIVKNMSPTLEECIKGSRGTKRTYLHNLMILITYGYKQSKIKAMKSPDMFERDKYYQKVFHHYEALRNLKKSLMAGKELLLRDMPEVKVSQQVRML